MATEGDSAEVATDMAARFDVYKAHLRLIAGYVPPRADVVTLMAGAADSTDYSAQWSSTLPGIVRTARIPGDHYSFLGAPATGDSPRS
jgi:hypothetical protein